LKVFSELPPANKVNFKMYERDLEKKVKEKDKVVGKYYAE
jgi:hypothetical protein